MRITVTQEHIDQGRAATGEMICRSCPVAMALQSAGFRDPLVFSRGAIYVWTDDATVNRCCYPGPEVKEWIHRFDAGEDVEPFAFDLDVTP